MNTRKTTPTLLQVIAAFTGIIGILYFIGSIINLGSDRDAPIGIAAGLGLTISSVFAYGFSYIVEAACRYLELTNGDNSPKIAPSNNPTKKSNVIHLGDTVKLKGTSKEFKVVKITEDGYICDNYENKYLPKEVEII